MHESICLDFCHVQIFVKIAEWICNVVDCSWSRVHTECWVVLHNIKWHWTRHSEAKLKIIRHAAHVHPIWIKYDVVKAAICLHLPLLPSFCIIYFVLGDRHMSIYSIVYVWEKNSQSYKYMHSQFLYTDKVIIIGKIIYKNMKFSTSDPHKMKKNNF